ncbi:MAG: hypothetical protein AAGF84_04615 [Planctomycetota bacterium]
MADASTLAPDTGLPLRWHTPFPLVDNGSVYLIGGDTNGATENIFRHDLDAGLSTFLDLSGSGGTSGGRIDSFSVDNGVAAYFNNVSTQETIATWNGTTGLTIADRSIPYPQADNPAVLLPTPAGTFSSLGAPYIEGDTVVFRGGYWGFVGNPADMVLHEGIYTADLSNGGQLAPVVDVGTIAPGQTGDVPRSFSHFATERNEFGFGIINGPDQARPVIDAAGNVAYQGLLPGETGRGQIYTKAADTGALSLVTFGGSGVSEHAFVDGVLTHASGNLKRFALDGTELSPVALRNELIPGTDVTMNFGGFQVAADGNRVLFVGVEADGRSAIYLFENGVATELLSTDDVLDGARPIPNTTGFFSPFEIGREALDGDTFAFRVGLEDITTGARRTAIYRGDLGTAPVPGSTPDNPLLPNPEDFPGICALTDACFAFTVADASLGTDEPIWIDPVPADGFEYEITGDANFLTVQLADGFGDDLYEIWALDSASEFVLVGTVGAFEDFDFSTLSAQGVSRFQVRGIEPGVPDTPPFGFPTGLRLTNGGDVAITMRAIPEPAAGAGLMLLSVALVRRK